MQMLIKCEFEKKFTLVSQWWNFFQNSVWSQGLFFVDGWFYKNETAYERKNVSYISYNFGYNKFLSQVLRLTLKLAK